MTLKSGEDDFVKVQYLDLHEKTPTKSVIWGISRSKIENFHRQVLYEARGD